MYNNLEDEKEDAGFESHKYNTKEAKPSETRRSTAIRAFSRRAYRILFQPPPSGSNVT